MTRQEAYERMVVAQDAYYAILPAFKTAEAKLRRNRRSGAAAEAYLAAREDAVTAPEDADASEGYVTRCQRCGVRARCLDRLTGEGYQRHRYASPQDGVCLRCERGRPYRGMAR